MLAHEYLGWFAVECGYRPDDVFDMPWVALVSLTLVADDMIAAREKAAEQS